MGTRRVLKPSREFSVLISFALLTTTLSILSYSTLSLLPKLWIGLIGITVPLWIFFQTSSPQESSADPLFVENHFPKIPVPAILIFSAAALFLRFGGLVSIHDWPLADEGMNTFVAMDFAKTGRFVFFPIFVQAPPLYFWLHGFFIRFFEPSLLTLWLWPALVSAVAALSALWAARQWFNRPTALWVFFLWALCFWPAYVGRYDSMEVLLLFWEMTALGVWGFWNNNRESPRGVLASLAWGAWMGAGFWVTLHWPFVAALLVTATVWEILRKGSSPGRTLGSFLAGFLLLSVPLGVAALHNDFGRYVGSLLGKTAGFGPLDQMTEGFKYVAAVFFGGGEAVFSYRPYWGGYLNPLLGALTLLGILEAWRLRRKPAALFLFFGIVLGLTPGFMTRMTEFFRITHAVPFVLLAACAGFLRLTGSFPARWRVAFALTVLSLSAGLDLFHLYKVGELGAGHLDRVWRNPVRSKPRAGAYAFLKHFAGEQGPGYVLSRLAPDSEDTSLDIAVYSFDRQNQSDPATPKSSWVAIYLEQSLAEGLAKLHPSGKVVSLPSGPVLETSLPKESMALYLLAWKGPTPEWVPPWIKADAAFESVIRQTITHKEGRGRTKILEAIRGAETFFFGDKILESLYWLRVAEFFRVQAVAGYYHPEILGSGDPKTLRRDLLEKEINALTRSEDAFPTRIAHARLSDLLAIRKSLQKRASTSVR